MKLQSTLNSNINQNLQLNQSKEPYKNQNQSKVSFGAGESVAYALNFLETNPAWGATAVDFFSMVAPRTAIDFTRGPEAGMETARRESVSMINDAALGVYGLGAAALLSRKLNKDFNVKAHNMFINDDTLDVLNGKWEKARQDLTKGTNEQITDKYLSNIFNEVKGFNPDIKDCDLNGWVGIDEKVQTSVVEKLSKAVHAKNSPEKMDKNLKSELKTLISDATGSEGTFKIAHGAKQAETSIDVFLDNVYRTAKAFKANSSNTKGFIDALKGLNSKAAVLGLVSSMVVGLGVQPLNVYLTKKKTGKTGFVGAESKDSDKSSGFKAARFGVAAAMMAGALATIQHNLNPKEIIKKIQFKSIWPTMNQFKLVYGATIVSRMLASRDSNELRETTLKDTLGFANWLIFGGIVSKAVAKGLDSMNVMKDGSHFIRYNEAENGKGFLNWLQNSKLESYEEILHTEFKKAGKEAFEGGKPMGITKMFKKARELKLPNITKRIGLRALIQLSGYLYSGIVLGVALPKVNIAMTKHSEKKQKQAAAKLQQIQAQTKAAA